MKADDLIAAIVMLLPGFVSTAVRDQLTPSAKKTDTDKILESLFWTFATYFPFALALGRTIPILAPDRRLDVGVLILVYIASIVVGGGRALAVRQGWGIDLARRLGLTDRVSEPSVWLFALGENSPGWAIVHLKNGRKLYGFIRAYDDDLDRSEFYMERVSELDENFETLRDFGHAGVLVTPDQALIVEFRREAP